MNNLAPDVLEIIRRRVKQLERENTELRAERDRHYANYRNAVRCHRAMRASRDRWRDKAKARQREIGRLGWHLVPEHPKSKLYLRKAA